jgi:hypothetical protein
MLQVHCDYSSSLLWISLSENWVPSNQVHLFIIMFPTSYVYKFSFYGIRYIYIPLRSIMYVYIYVHIKIPLYSIIFHYIPLYSIILLYSIIFHYIPLYSIIFHYIPLLCTHPNSFNSVHHILSHIGVLALHLTLEASWVLALHCLERARPFKHSPGLKIQIIHRALISVKWAFILQDFHIIS